MQPPSGALNRDECRELHSSKPREQPLTHWKSPCLLVMLGIGKVLLNGQIGTIHG